MDETGVGSGWWRGVDVPARAAAWIGGTMLLLGALPAQTDWMPARLATGRSSTAMVYDGARQRVVRFGGYDPADGKQELGDTWEWDGVTWVQRLPAASPPPRGNHAMAYDAARQRVVLFGGQQPFGQWSVSLGDTWEWDGVNWTQMSPTSTPSPRWGHALAYDAARQQVVLFGGVATYGLPAGDTWVWDGVNWTQRTPTVSPPARRGHAMAYDAARQQVVLCGGDDGTRRLPFMDTWEWDGVTWAHKTPTALPTSVVGHAMVYDAARQRVVLFGGEEQFYGYLGGTAEWDGAKWEVRYPATRPTPRIGHAMAYDAARQRVVLFGGSDGLFPLGVTWEWDGVTWVQLHSAKSALPRSGHAMAYDAARQQVVVFGGFGYAYGGGFVRGDTWVWDGVAWAEATPTGSPPARASHGMAYDAARQRVVLFGGSNPYTNTWFADTWEWDGTTWTQRHPAASPTAWGPLTYDAARQRVVLFGLPANGVLGETWEWDGTNWTQRNPPASPTARGGHALAYDAARQRVILFGGNPRAGGVIGDTWEWDGATWTQRNPPQNAPARQNHALVYDVARQRVVLFGGGSDLSGYDLGDTWEWDGATWVQRNPTAGPSARRSHALAYDAARQRVVLFGGGWYLGDTWLHGDLVPASAQAIGSACPGTNGPPVLTSSVPFLGNPAFLLELHSIRAQAACLFVLDPNTQTLQLGGGCSLYLAGFLLPVFATANAGGFADVQLAIPHDVSLRGASAYAQGFVVDPLGPVAGLALSAARRLVFGD